MHWDSDQKCKLKKNSKNIVNVGMAMKHDEDCKHAHLKSSYCSSDHQLGVPTVSRSCLGVGFNMFGHLAVHVLLILLFAYPVYMCVHMPCLSLSVPLLKNRYANLLSSMEINRYLSFKISEYLLVFMSIHMHGFLCCQIKWSCNSILHFKAFLNCKRFINLHLTR